MADLFLFFSHKLTDIQIKDAKEIFNVSEIISLPEQLQTIWSNIPPTGDIVPIIAKFVSYLSGSSKVGDYVLVEGDFGITFAIADWCLDNNRIPIYATTKRFADSKNIDGFTKMTHYFSHVMFRKYQRME